MTIPPVDFLALIAAAARIEVAIKEGYAVFAPAMAEFDTLLNKAIENGASYDELFEKIGHVASMRLT